MLYFVLTDRHTAFRLYIVDVVTDNNSLLYFAWVDQRVQPFYNYHIGSYKTVVG